MITPLICGFITLFALGAVVFRNPIYSLLSLVVSFCGVASLMIYVGLAYVGFMLLIVYIGAVAILFLFVIMMLNINEEALRPILKQKRLVFPLLLAGGFAGALMAAFQQKQRLVALVTQEIVFDFYDMADLMFSKYGGGVLIVAFMLLNAMIAAVTILGARKTLDKTMTDYQKVALRTPENSIQRRKQPLYSGADWS